MATGYNLRIGDADREAIAAQLREHFADGRLTLEELNERLDQTFAAKTGADLNVVMRDLPHVARPLTGAPAGNASWQGTRDPAAPGPAGRSGWDYANGNDRQRRPFFFAPIMALAWVALVASAVTLFGIGGDRPLAIVLIIAAFGFLRRLIGFGGRSRGPRGPRGRRGPRRGPRGPRF
jgi:hypothetical protein